MLVKHARELEHDADRGGVVDRTRAVGDGVVVRHHEQRRACGADAREHVGIFRFRGVRVPQRLPEQGDLGQLDRADGESLRLEAHRGELAGDVIRGAQRSRRVAHARRRGERIDMREHAVDIDAGPGRAGATSGNGNGEERAERRPTHCPSCGSFFGGSLALFGSYLSKSGLGASGSYFSLSDFGAASGPGGSGPSSAPPGNSDG